MKTRAELQRELNALKREVAAFCERFQVERLSDVSVAYTPWNQPGPGARMSDVEARAFDREDAPYVV